MQKRRKILSLGVCATALAVALVGGTMAYLTDTASDVNVMALGDVKIEQIELQRAEDVAYDATAAEGSLVPFEQGQLLMPAVPTGDGAYTAEKTDLFAWGPYVTADSDDEAGTAASNGLWNDSKLSNQMDKFVFVKNTGKVDAYYRTIIAFECPEGMDYSSGADKQFMMNVNMNTRFTWEDLDYTNIDGTRYLIMVATYNKPLPAGEISRPSLLQVVMTDKATNEDVAKLGDIYDIRVLSQAVQADGFQDAETALDAGFGDVTVEKAAEWFGGIKAPVAVDTADELSEALAAGNSVYLTADITDNRTFEVAADKDVTIYMNGHTLTSMDGGQGKNYALSVSAGASLTLKGDGKIVASCYGVSVKPNATFTMNSGEIVVRGNGTYDYGVVVWNGATFVMNGGKITAAADVYAAYTTNESYVALSTEQPTVVINGGELLKEGEAYNYITTDCTPNVMINGGTFDNVKFSGNVSDYITKEQ